MSDDANGERAEIYRVVPRARDDLSDIWRTSAETWSVGQADSHLSDIFTVVDLLVAFPEVAREQLDIVPPVRIHPHRSHLVVHRIENGRVTIQRVLHARQDWLSLLRGNPG